MLNDNLLALIPLDVCIPVQEFRVDYTIVQNNQLPFVREFILRLLDLGNMTKDQIGKFMGFTEKETQVALNQLMNLDEIVVHSSGTFQLTSKSRGYFSTQQENRPKIQCLEELRKSFRFDLLTFSYIKSSVIVGNDMSAIRLYPSEEDISTSVKLARSAFQRQFHQIHEEEDFGYLVIDNPELYKISSFKKQSEKFLRFSQTYGIDTNRNTIEPVISDEFLSKDQVVTLLSNFLRDNRPVNNIGDVARVFDSLEYDYGVSMLKRDALEVADYAIEAKKSLRDAGTSHKPLIGSLMLKANWSILEEQIEAAIRDHDDPVKVMWIAPLDGYWAKSDRQLQCFENISSQKDVELEVYLPIPHRKDRKVSKAYLNQFRSVKESLHGFVEGYLTGLEEIVIVSDKCAFVICYMYQNEDLLPIPVGFMTQSPLVVSSLSSSFCNYLTAFDQEFEAMGLGPLCGSDRK